MQSVLALHPEASPRVLVVGDIMLDRYLWGSCDRVSPEAPVQVVNVQRETYSLGGAGNVIANLATLGARVSFLGLVGADNEHLHLRRLLQQYGVDDSHMIADASRPTTIKTRVVAVPQQIVRFDVEVTTALDEPLQAEVLARFARLLPGHAVVVLSDYGKGLLTGALTRQLLALCREQGIPAFVDPKGTNYDKYRGATLITPNRKEAGAALGVELKSSEAISEAGRRLLRAHDLDACLITLSEDGMALFQGESEDRLPTEARAVFDVTGAGDTVIAAVAFGYASGMNLLEACRFANQAAGIVVGKVGSATVTIAEIRAAGRPPELALADKVVEPAVLRERLRELQSKGKRVVFTNGCFDILHAGHVRYLAAAAALGDALVVGLNSDDSVRRLKGESRPINGQDDRGLLLAALASVDYVVMFGEDTPLELIRHLQPNILVKGGDYRADDVVGAVDVVAGGGRVQILPFLEGRSTTKVIDRIREVAP